MKLVKFNAFGTGLFLITTTIGAMFFGQWKLVSAWVAGLLFAVGFVTMLMAFARAVTRSRTDAIGIGGLYFLAGKVAPGFVRRPLLVLLGVQVVVGLAGAIARPFTPLAYGVLAPLFGLGLNGLWGARFGSFEPRNNAGTAPMGQNRNHG